MSYSFFPLPMVVRCLNLCRSFPTLFLILTIFVIGFQQATCFVLKDTGWHGSNSQTLSAISTANGLVALSARMPDDVSQFPRTSEACLICPLLIRSMETTSSTPTSTVPPVTHVASVASASPTPTVSQTSLTSLTSPDTIFPTSMPSSTLTSLDSSDPTPTTPAPITPAPTTSVPTTPVPTTPAPTAPASTNRGAIATDTLSITQITSSPSNDRSGSFLTHSVTTSFASPNSSTTVIATSSKPKVHVVPIVIGILSGVFVVLLGATVCIRRRVQRRSSNYRRSEEIVPAPYLFLRRSANLPNGSEVQLLGINSRGHNSNDQRNLSSRYYSKKRVGASTSTQRRTVTEAAYHNAYPPTLSVPEVASSQDDVASLAVSPSTSHLPGQEGDPFPVVEITAEGLPSAASAESSDHRDPEQPSVPNHNEMDIVVTPAQVQRLSVMMHEFIDLWTRIADALRGQQQEASRDLFWASLPLSDDNCSLLAPPAYSEGTAP